MNFTFIINLSAFIIIIILWKKKKIKLLRGFSIFIVISLVVFVFIKENQTVRFNTIEEAFHYSNPNDVIINKYSFLNHTIVEGHTTQLIDYTHDEKGWNNATNNSMFGKSASYTLSGIEPRCTISIIKISDINSSFLTINQFDTEPLLSVDDIQDNYGNAFYEPENPSQFNRIYTFVQGCPSDYILTINNTPIKIDLSKSYLFRGIITLAILLVMMGSLIYFAFCWFKRRNSKNQRIQKLRKIP